MRVKIISVGNSSGIALPKKILDRLDVKKGDSLYIVPTDYGVKLTPYDPDFEEQLETAKTIMRKNRDVLKKLAE